MVVFLGFSGTDEDRTIISSHYVIYIWGCKYYAALPYTLLGSIQPLSILRELSISVLSGVDIR